MISSRIAPAPVVSVPKLRLRDIRLAVGVSRERLGRILDVSAKSVERWEASESLPSAPHTRDLLMKLADVVDLGTVVYGNDGFALFLTTPLPTFGGRTALQTLERGQVSDVLGALAGDYEGLGY